MVFSVRVTGDLDCNDGEALCGWARLGLGLGWRSTWEIAADLSSGALTTVLDAFAVPSYDILAVYRQQAYLPAKVQRFVAFLREIYASPGYWR